MFMLVCHATSSLVWGLLNTVGADVEDDEDDDSLFPILLNSYGPRHLSNYAPV